MNFTRLTVAFKIGLTILIITITLLITTGIASYWTNKTVVQDTNTNELNLIIDFEEQRLESAINEMEQDLKFIEGNELVKKFVFDCSKGTYDSIERLEKRQYLNKRFFSNIVEIHDYEDLIITDYTGKILYIQSNLTKEGILFKKHLSKRICKFHFDNKVLEDGNVYTYASRPIKNSAGETIGIVYCKADVIQLLTEITYISDFATEVVISYGIKTLDRVVPYQATKDGGFNGPGRPIDDTYTPLFLACMGNTGSGFFTNHLEKEVLTAYRPLKPFNIGVMAEIDKKTIFGSTTNSLTVILYLSLILLLITIAISYLLIRNINSGLKPIQKVINQISDGVFPQPVVLKTHDQFKQISFDLNESGISYNEFIKSVIYD